mmetsp:Transcript_7369/g.12481  ORF Transcript_7369/g.12481 Transcript_7369/m.12481 type:complete len:975 (-) Transcript_7369:1461-4385(-)
MRLPIAASSLLATTVGLLSTAALFNDLLIPSSTLFATAAQTCAGGGRPNSDGTCANPDMVSSSDDADEEDSSDDAEAADASQYSGNPNAHKLEEGEEKPPTTCDSYLKLEGFKDAVYETRSFYQEVAWSENPNKPDVCMSLDDILQICHSYRPHYHEPYVHFPAAYMKEMKRVAFIGGGDSMLLHEALKYPNVEMVLGLELDQKVVRESLKHFHTQPHFEDPRVQWWFGDASKSLALLPREWFGTFDLVMVDLSETAMSISVTDDLDIFGALALLMKPEGIFVKNELYYGQMSKLFDHSVFVYMTDYPILCDQDWAMGSNSVDFLHPQIEGGLFETHKVSAFEYNPLDDVDEHYKLIKDYSHNNARKQGKCDLYDKEVAEAKNPIAKADPVKPAKSTGVLLVVEAEGVTEFSALETLVKDLLVAEGLTPLGPAEAHNASGSVATAGLFIAMEEGYVTAHYYPGHSHVGLEIVLWSKIAKHDDVRKALLGSLGVKNNYSAFRVIHGGMLGAKNWREDINAVGPVNKNLRQCDPEVTAAEPQVGEGPIPTDTFNAAVAAGLTMLPKKMDKVIAVVCGKKGKDACKTAESLEKNAKVDNVVAIWTCDSKEEGKNDNSESISNVYLCDTKDLKRVAKIEEGFSAVVVDPEASPEFVQSQADVFCKNNDAGQHALLRDEVTFMTSLNNDAAAIFYAGCVKKLIKPNVRSSRIIIDKTSQFGIIGTGSKGFVRKTVEIQKAIEKKTGIPTAIAKMVGGPVQQQREFDPEHYPANAYDERDSLKQYTNQKPIASQSLYHYEIDDKSGTPMSAKLIKETLDFVIAKNSKFAGAKRANFNDEIGDGSISAAIVAGGHIIVTWDGASKVTFNILTPGEKYEPVSKDEEDTPAMVLVDHKIEVIDKFMSKLPTASNTGLEQMPRGSNRVVNFKKDINAIPDCTDHYDLCFEFSKEGDCEDEDDGEWMHRFCSLSCGTCDKMMPLE